MENDLIYIDVEKGMLSSEGLTKLTICEEIKPAEFLTIFGPSGAGKTTLLRILAGLIKPDKGTIRVGNKLWFDSRKGIHIPPQRRNLSLMFQDFALFPNMTVEENILYAQKTKDNKQKNELLESFGLLEFKNKKPQSMSGGQKQRVALARALARKPQLLLLDEPLSALDAARRADLQQHLTLVHNQMKCTCVLVSHDLNEVFRLSDRVWCIDHGCIVQQGTPEALFSDSSISGKVQITGQLARIDPQGNMYILTVISGNNQVIKVIAFESDMENLHIGDSVMVFTKAFNPIIKKITL